MKSFTIATLLLSAIFCYLCVSVSAGSVSWGVQTPYDRLLARDVIQKKAAWFGKETVTVSYPPKNMAGFSILSAIHAIDLGGVENYATAELVQGGPGSTSATIKIKSQKRRPINMIVEYYGQ